MAKRAPWLPDAVFASAGSLLAEGTRLPSGWLTPAGVAPDIAGARHPQDHPNSTSSSPSHSRRHSLGAIATLPLNLSPCRRASGRICFPSESRLFEGAALFGSLGGPSSGGSGVADNKTGVVKVHGGGVTLEREIPLKTMVVLAEPSPVAKAKRWNFMASEQCMLCESADADISLVHEGMGARVGGMPVRTAHRAMCSCCFEKDTWFSEQRRCFVCRQHVAMVVRHVPPAQLRHVEATFAQFADGDLPAQLFAAARLGDAERVKYLVTVGGQSLLNSTDRDQATALHYAALGGHVEVVRALHAASHDWPAMLGAVDVEEDMAVHCAAMHGHDHVIRVLHELAAGLPVFQVRDGHYATPWHRAALHGHVAVIRALHELTGESNRLEETDADGDSVLHYAVLGGVPEVIMLLRELARNWEWLVALRNREQNTVLHYAARDGSDAVVRLLHKLITDWPAALVARNEAQVTVLHCAAAGDTSGHEVVVRTLHALAPDWSLLLDAGDMYGARPVHYASIAGNDVVLQALVELAPDREALLLSHGVDRASPLHFASQFGHPQVVSFLCELARQYPSILDMRDVHDATPLHYAAKEGHELVVRLLLQARPAYVDAVDMNGSTPLHYVAIHGHASLVSVLHEFAKDWPALYLKEDAQGELALACASSNGHDTVVQVLQELAVPKV